MEKIIDTNNEKIDKDVQRLKACPCCKGFGTVDENYLQNNLTVYGMSLREILLVREFADKKGWKYEKENS